MSVNSVKFLAAVKTENMRFVSFLAPKIYNRHYSEFACVNLTTWIGLLVTKQGLTCNVLTTINYFVNNDLARESFFPSVTVTIIINYC